MNLGRNYATALRKKYEAVISEAEANLSLYFSGVNLAGIGEHSDLLEEYDKWITKLSDAKGKLEVLASLESLYTQDEMLK